MAVFFDRVKDMTTTTGTGDITLSGTAPTGYRAFGDVFAVGNDNFYYVIANATESEWESGLGYLDPDAVTLVRSNVYASSNAGAAVDFSAGTKTIFHTASAVFFTGVLTDMADLSTAIVGINASLGTVQTDMTTLQGDVTTLNDSVGTLQNDMTTAQADIVALQSGGSSLSIGKVEAMRLGAAML